MNPAIPATDGGTQVSPWCDSALKRALDVVLSFALLLASAPLLLLGAVAVKLSSPGPVFFRQLRIGRCGQPFTLFKLRTMVVCSAGAGITRSGDGRVTTVGRLLRATKVDELPQLWNVLRGDMSLIGPRPEVPQFVELYSKRELQLLQVRPGVTGAASVTFRNEETLLAAVPPDSCTKYYATTIMPEKARIDLEYMRRATLQSDIALLAQTALEVLVPRPSTHNPTLSRTR